MDVALTQAFKEKIERTVTRLFEHYTAPALVYHNLEHTRRVVARAREIASHYSLSEEDGFILFASAWWHDTGQLFSPPQNHEEESVQLMVAFFSLHDGAPSHIITTIEHAILATKLPQSPRTLVEEILCDADTYHLGTDEFEQINELVLQEAVMRLGVKRGDWTAATARLLMAHSFHTSYCREKLDAGKARNVALLEARKAAGGEL